MDLSNIYEPGDLVWYRHISNYKDSSKFCLMWSLVSIISVSFEDDSNGSFEPIYSFRNYAGEAENKKGTSLFLDTPEFRKKIKTFLDKHQI